MTGKTISADQLLKRAYSLDNESQTRELYRDWASSYDQTMLDGLSYLTPSRTAGLLATWLEDNEARILDIGSGTGLAGAALSRLGFDNLDALDFSVEMLREAAARREDGRPVYTKIIEADLNAPLDIADSSYKALICTGTFTHAHVGASCLHELVRILEPGGFFACTVHKDIWEPEGFRKKVDELHNAGKITTHMKQLDIYFESDSEPQGWYIVWEKT